MQLGLFLNTHGVTNRDDRDWWHQEMLAQEMRPVESAQLAERLGYHSVWMGDHIAPPAESPGSSNYSGGERKRHYAEHPNILDGAVVLGAIATNTSRIKMGPSVLISPYRHPLSDARQYMTIDFLSNGRLIMGVGSGWMKEEFEVLGHGYYAERLQVLEECMQIYAEAWTRGVVTFHGRFFDFEHVSLYPLPVRKPRPPMVVGAMTKGGARLAARRGDGFFPILTQSFSRPHDHDRLIEEVKREATNIGRDNAEIALLGLTSCRISKHDNAEALRQPRWNLGGTAEQILEDLQGYADAGYSLMVMAPICPSRTFAEFQEQAEWLGREVIVEAKKIATKGDWKTDL
jgi:probable F420-dependent oxidoreductase